MKTKKDKSLAASVPAGSESAVRGKCPPYGPGAQYFDLLNELLRNATPMGAYSVGLVSALAWQDGLDPNEAELRAALKCSTFKQVIAFIAPEGPADERTSDPNPASEPNSKTKEPV